VVISRYCMVWWATLALIVGGLLVLMLIRVPVAFAFLAVNSLAAIFVLGGTDGLEQLVMSTRRALGSFALAAVPPFIFMGEVMFLSGVAPRMIDALDKWLGRIPARLGLLAVGSGTLLSTLTGSSMASTAMLGSTLLPEMQRRGYKPPLSFGPILGSGGLAVMIPPTALGVLLASLARISIGDFLLGIIFPGLLIALLLGLYVVGRALLQPDLVPAYVPERARLLEKLLGVVKYVAPISIVVFFVVGLIILGVATPTESAAMGALGTILLASLHRALTARVFVHAVGATLRISVMMLIIVAGSTAFSQILSFSGVTRELVALVGGLDVHRLVILAIIQGIVLVMGTFMESLSILLVTLPVFMPIAQQLEFDLVWFAILLLVNIEASLISPPFGLALFVVRSVAPRGTTMGQIYTSALPLIGIYVAAIAILVAVPAIATWLPAVSGP
jgi:tripartite ATP-independent transporter DctM subunit